MKQDWSPEELSCYFTLSIPERQFLSDRGDVRVEPKNCSSTAFCNSA